MSWKVFPPPWSFRIICMGLGMDFLHLSQFTTNWVSEAKETYRQLRVWKQGSHWEPWRSAPGLALWFVWRCLSYICLQASSLDKQASAKASGPILMTSSLNKAGFWHFKAYIWAGHNDSKLVGISSLNVWQNSLMKRSFIGRILAPDSISLILWNFQHYLILFEWYKWEFCHLALLSRLWCSLVN